MLPKISAIFYGNPDRYPPIINGVRLLAKNGYHIDVLCRNTGEKPNVNYPQNVRIIRIGSPTKSSLSEYTQFNKKVFQLFDRATALLIGHDMHALFPARLLSSIYHRPLIYQSHELVDRSSKLGIGGHIVYTLQQIFARTANLVIVPDKDRANFLQTSLKLAKKPLVVTNSPMNVPSKTGEILLSTLRERNFSFEKIVFRQGTIGPSHAIETTISSMTLWKNSRWGFVIMGPMQQEYINTVQKLACDLGVNNRFVILPPVPYDDVLSFTSGATIGHSLYSPIDSNNRLSTTASNKLMEYMAAGLPLLVSDRPSLRHFVESYQCGITADESSPESIASAVNTLLENPTLATQMGAAGQSTFVAEFSYQRQFEPVLVTIGSLLRQSLP